MDQALARTTGSMPPPGGNRSMHSKSTFPLPLRERGYKACERSQHLNSKLITTTQTLGAAARISGDTWSANFLKFSRNMLASLSAWAS